MRHSAQEQTRTDESKPKHIHRSLDHVIGVQIPASQPRQSLLQQAFTIPCGCGPWIRRGTTLSSAPSTRSSGWHSTTWATTR